MVPRDDRDDQPPKSGPLHQRPATQPVLSRDRRDSTAVPIAQYEDVTSRIDLSDDKELSEARFRRDVMRTQRTLGIKIAAGNKVFRDAFRRMDEERIRRRDAEVERARLREAARIRRDKTLRFIVTKIVPIIAGIAGLITALKG